MEDVNQQIITKLNSYKREGLTFYQASERLKQQGYTPGQITDTTSQLDYAGLTPGSSSAQPEELPKASTPLNPRGSESINNAYQKMGNCLLADKERSTRPYAYVGMAITAGYFAQSIYRFWLTRKFWGSNGSPRYFWANNVDYYILAGATGAIIATLGLKLYFNSRDRLYKRINETIDKDTVARSKH